MYKLFLNWYERYFSNEDVLVLLILIFFFGIVIWLLGSLLIPFFAAVVIAYLLEGMIQPLMKHGVRRFFAIFIVYTLFLSSLATIFFILLPLSWGQLATFANDQLPLLLEKTQALIQLLPERYPSLITEDQVSQWMLKVQEAVTGFAEWIISSSLFFIPNLLAMFIFFILVPVIVFFLLKDRDELMTWFSRWLPSDRPLIKEIWEETDKQITNYIRGKLAEILIVGAVTYISFLLLNLNYALLLSVLVGLSVIIPFIGAAIITIPVAVVAYFQFGFESDFITVLVVYSIIQAVDGNVLVPLLFSEAVNLHPVAIILAVVIFGGIWGLWGVFFAIPLATLIKAIISAWSSQLQQHQRISDFS